MSISGVDDRWSKHLPRELADMIVKRLGLVDSKTFAAVCSSWRSVTMASQWLATQFPCSLQSLPYEACSAGTPCYSLYSPCEDRAANNLKFPKEIVDRDGMASYCSGCFGSWLIIAEHRHNPKTAKSYFFNPVSGACIALPPHRNRSFFVRDDETGWNEKVVVKTVASSDPTYPNCIVAALTLHAHKLAFCRPNDASWTLRQSRRRWLWLD
ncbi:F-box/kelch-repeat protein At3g18720-like [Rosa chinensis]|uniref:F-box/kelch-repeat protein At3g18720-like n=1 Tax=Rosa chinensis TaxID=74649 RepID=UPI000D08CCB6|nr:F-box/kelch-repeat protein At3g18720-like [Rosa chinensis]